MDFKTVSLFTGAGGLDIGLEQAGIHTAIAQDFDAAACATLELNGVPYLKGDIREIQSSQLWQDSQSPFLVAGGPPCQSFSNAGKMGGGDDPRGQLYHDFFRVVFDLKPRFFVFENVAAILQYEDVILDITATIGKIGYTHVSGVLAAEDYGTPQFRDRLIILGSRDGEAVFLPKPTHHKQHQLAAYRWVTLTGILNGLTTCEHSNLSPAYTEAIKLIPEGGCWRDLPDDIAREVMGGAYLSGGGKTGYFRRLKWAEPSVTLVTSPAQKATMRLHPSENRVLSVQEYARIQGFPDDWKFAGGLAARYRQIGNAVPTQLGRAIGESLKSVVDGNHTVNTKRK